MIVNYKVVNQDGRIPNQKDQIYEAGSKSLFFYRCNKSTRNSKDRDYHLKNTLVNTIKYIFLTKLQDLILNIFLSVSDNTYQ